MSSARRIAKRIPPTPEYSDTDREHDVAILDHITDLVSDAYEKSLAGTLTKIHLDEVSALVEDEKRKMKLPDLVDLVTEEPVSMMYNRLGIMKD